MDIHRFCFCFVLDYNARLKKNEGETEIDQGELTKCRKRNKEIL